MYTGSNLDNWDKAKLILMSQVRQLSLVTSHPYFAFCRHITLNFVFEIVFFVNKVIAMQLPIKECGLFKIMYETVHDYHLFDLCHGDELQLERKNQ